MLRKLSLRNAKRQFREYALYFVTLSFTVSLMYAFQTLLFSDSVKALSRLEIFPLMIAAASILIVFIIGQIISYMTNYMLRKRSREFGIYMLSGIPGKAVGTLVFYEDTLIGTLAFLPGLPAGMLLSQVLEAVLLPLFGLSYTPHFPLSLPAAGLTFLYFAVMLLYSLLKNGKWIRRITLYELLLFDRKNEKSLLAGSTSAVAVFFLSALLGGSGILLLYFQPFGSGYDVLVGTVFLVLFLFGFFLSVPSFLCTQLGGRISWKYRKDRLVLFRNFTAKIQSAGLVMGMLSVLFMLALTFMGTGTVVSMVITKKIELSAFDILILHNKELRDFTDYETLLRQSVSIRASLSYGIYTGMGRELAQIRDDSMAQLGGSGSSIYTEFQTDTCMKQSDYSSLRRLLGYDAAQLDPSSCYIHCVPGLAKRLEAYTRQEERPYYAGYPFAADGVFTGPFSQTEAYGNGLDYIIIVPDDAVTRMKVLYSLYAAVTEAPPDNRFLQNITKECPGLVRLERNRMKSVPESNTVTALTEDADYFSGKWAERENMSHLYAMIICLFYLALVLEAAGAAILATQVLGDREKKRRQERILGQLGMSRRLAGRLGRRQLSLFFLLPVLPALVVSSSFVYVGAVKIHAQAFRFPVFGNTFWVIRPLAVSFLLFALLYGVYYAAARISYRQERIIENG